MFNLTMPWLASDYYGFVTMMTLLVGLAFQFPLVVIILQYLEIVQTRTLFRVWRHVLVGILVASLVISPLGDPVSLSVLTGILFLLYIAAAAVGGLLVRAKIKKRDAEEAEYERTYGRAHPRRAAALAKIEDTSEGYGNNYGTDDGSTDNTGGRGDGSSYYGEGMSGDSGASGESWESGESGESASAGEVEPAGEGGEPGIAADSGTSIPAEEAPENVAEDSEEAKAAESPAPASAVTPLGRKGDLDLIE
jgi:uncharacterized membrane protein YgcG